MATPYLVAANGIFWWSNRCKQDDRDECVRKLFEVN
jgi:hypothetical protein